MLTTWLSPSSSFRLAKKSSNSEVQSMLLTGGGNGGWRVSLKEGKEEKEEKTCVHTEEGRLAGGGGKLDSPPSRLPLEKCLTAGYWEHGGRDAMRKATPKTLQPCFGENTSKLWLFLSRHAG